MSSMQNVSAEDLARLFHHYHEALAHDFHGHATREVDPCWEQAPQDHRKLMVAAARLTLLELAANAEQAQTNRQYFATPGEADWGCRRFEAFAGDVPLRNLYESFMPFLCLC